MKKLLLFMVVILSLNAKAQTDFLGKDEAYIKGYIEYSKSYVLQSRDILKKHGDKVITLVYHPNDNDTTGLFPLTFILKNDTCKLFMISSGLQDLPVMISSLNKHYDRIDDTHWIDKHNMYEATLDKQENGFYITFKRL